MIGELPESLEIGGKLYKINADFRVILNIFQAFDDPELTEREKCFVCMKNLFADFESIPEKDLQTAINQAYWFVGGGNMPEKNDVQKAKIIDWEQDESLYFPAINKVAGFETRAVKFLHWWTFLGYFNEIGEGLFSQILHIRSKKSDGKKLEKWEKEFLQKNKNIVEIRKKYTQEEIEKQKILLARLGG
ncbi:MAG: bacteriophage Gp15 family protein [Ruminococcus sp.]|nr:bacteriophage Gp15 family protein [Ruminococcus sp.]